jgi:hypothetical protein
MFTTLCEITCLSNALSVENNLDGQSADDELLRKDETFVFDCDLCYDRFQSIQDLQTHFLTLYRIRIFDHIYRIDTLLYGDFQCAFQD